MARTAGLNVADPRTDLRSAGTGGYLSQLDALRFFAVTGVMVTHNWGPQFHVGPVGQPPWGSLGVRLFFVLSGFLITGILIRCRDLAERSPERRLFFIRQFYIRRFLRIFPVYYLTLVVIVAVGVGMAPRIWPWLFSYTTNVYVWSHLSWPHAVGHFWSLAVEEQFYLVWPWLMLFLPRRWLVPVLVVLVVLVAPGYRLYASFHYAADTGIDGGFTSLSLTPAVLDSLGLGALLAFATNADESIRAWTRRALRRVALPLGAAAYVVFFLVGWHLGPFRHVAVALSDTSAALVFCWLIAAASRGVRGPMGALLEWRPIAYLGKVSYGIYIFHMLVPIAFGYAAARLGLGYTNAGFANFLVTSAVTCAVAALSWELFEGPINALKRHFRYEAGETVVPVTAAAPAAAQAAP
jgi:peptidoglycan/LPS O-acetylase OafA/YrhL